MSQPDGPDGRRRVRSGWRRQPGRVERHGWACVSAGCVQLFQPSVVSGDKVVSVTRCYQPCEVDGSSRHPDNIATPGPGPNPYPLRVHQIDPAPDLIRTRFVFIR
ncbi:hypothetical protein ACOMHN_011834 [Nucella lapillus]